MGIAAMNPSDPTVTDERLSAWLEACDAALASGAQPPTPDGAGLAPELLPRAARGLAALQRLHRWLPRTLPAPPDTPANSGELPWTNLGRFRLVRELGRGGFGRVFLAHDPQLGRQVALKVPHPETLIPELRERFHREAQAASALDHPNLVPVFEVGETGPVCFIVSPYCPGVSLAQWLHARDEPVPFADAAALLSTLAEAVQHAHSHGVVHRDLKPANILLVSAGRKPPESAADSGGFRPPLSEYTPRITDFGLAKLLAGDSAGATTRSRVVTGTPSYMAPEQARGQSRDVGPACDVYGLGAILYELLTGRPPFQSESDLDTLLHVQVDEPVSPIRLRPRTPRDLQTICLNCLRKEPERRYASAQALADDLRRFLRGEAIQARPAGPIERLGRWARRNPTLAAVTGLAALALVGIAVLALSFASYQARAAEGLRQKEAEALAALEEARRQADLVRRQAALSALDQGLTLCEQGHVRRGTPWLAHSAEIAGGLPSSVACDIEHAARINLAAWRCRLPALAALFPHPGPVRAVAFSPDGKLVLTGCGDGTARFWDADSGQPAGPELRHGGEVRCVCVSGDGKSVATGGTDGVRLWRAATGERLAEFKQAATVLGVALSPDGRLVLAGSPNGAAIGPAEPGATLAELPGWRGQTNAVAFCEGGKTVVAGCLDGMVRLWDAAKKELLPCKLPHNGQVLALALSPDGQTLLTGSADESARLWKMSTCELVARIPHQGFVNAVAFSPDGQTLVTTSGWLARTWDAASQRPVSEPLPHCANVPALAFRPGSRQVLTGSSDGTARLWEFVGDRAPDRVFSVTGIVQQVAFSPDGRLALSAGFDRLGHLWDTATGEELRRLVGHTHVINSVAFSPDGKIAATGSEDHSAGLWDVATGRERCPRLAGHTAPVNTVVFSPDGSKLLTVDFDGGLRVWDVSTGRLAFAVRHTGKIGSWAAAFNPEGTSFAAGSIDGGVRLWSAADGHLLREWRPGGWVAAVKFSPKGQLLLTTARDRRACLWVASSGEADGAPLPHQGIVRSVGFSEDGSRFVTAGFDHTARVWDLASRKLVGPPVRHEGGIRDAALSPDGRLLVTGSFDHFARVWDVATGRPVGPPLAFGNWAVSVAFRPDGGAVLAGSCDGTIRLRDVPAPVEGSPGHVRARAELLAGMELNEKDGPHVIDVTAWTELRRRQDGAGEPPAP
jgi:WD40 repeat protein